MNAVITNRDHARDKLSRLGALGFLLVLSGLALAGPYGLLSWGENIALLEQRQDRIATLQAERDVLKRGASKGGVLAPPQPTSNPTTTIDLRKLIDLFRHRITNRASRQAP